MCAALSLAEVTNSISLAPQLSNLWIYWACWVCLSPYEVESYIYIYIHTYTLKFMINFIYFFKHSTWFQHMIGGNCTITKIFSAILRFSKAKILRYIRGSSCQSIRFRGPTLWNGIRRIYKEPTHLRQQDQYWIRCPARGWTICCMYAPYVRVTSLSSLSINWQLQLNRYWATLFQSQRFNEWAFWVHLYHTYIHTYIYEYCTNV